MKKIISKINVIVMAVILMMTAGCHSAKGVVTDTNTNTTDKPQSENTIDLPTRLSTFAQGQLDWNTLQVSGNVKVGGAQSFSSAMQMRMIRDSVIYISLRPLLGIEVGKIVITRDSVLVVDKYHKRYIAEPTSLITNDIPVTVSTMQDIFLGRAFVLGAGSVNASNTALVELNPDGNGYRLTPATQPVEFTYSFGIDKGNHLLSLDITPTRGKQTPYSAAYSDVRTTLAGNIAHHAQVEASVNGKKFTLALDLKNVSWNPGNLKIDDTLPTGYKRMDGKQITSILEKND